MASANSVVLKFYGNFSIFEMAINVTQKRIANAIYMPTKLLRIGVGHLEKKWRKRNFARFFFFYWWIFFFGKNWFFSNFFLDFFFKSAEFICFEWSKRRPIGRKRLCGCYVSTGTVGSLKKIVFLEKTMGKSDCETQK